MNKQKEQAEDDGNIEKWEEPVASNHDPLCSLLTYLYAGTSTDDYPDWSHLNLKVPDSLNWISINSKYGYKAAKRW